MRVSISSSGIKAAVFLTTIASTPAALAEPPATAHPQGHYATLDKLPDWGGVWFLQRTPAGTKVEQPEFIGEYLADYQRWQQLVRDNQGQAPRRGSNCRPPGMPGMMGTAQYPIEFLFTPGRVTILHEAWMQWRKIWTDGRPHPDDLETGFFGHSIGSWDGDTLVVDTVGIKDTVDLGQGMRHSDQLRISERFHLAPGEPDTLVIEMVVTDAKALAKPWHRRFAYSRDRDSELYEFVCAENDLNPVDEAGYTSQLISE
ncbi:MAG: hypothetical protein IT494_05315 [Gammaproteobacteria bacterium]|nr:hypothetical protein [Gammaproteobacteria bacterium]